jgi:Zn-finger nucleic acid-binding protein
MNCPIDGTELRVSDRQGVEIDYCPKCRGVWLDRGELDKIIERNARSPYSDEPRSSDRDRESVSDRNRERDRDDDYYDDRRGDGKRRRRRSFLDDLFDLD